MADSALTPKHLVDLLRETGRHVTERALTDWRSPRRQLLPALTATGRGRGKGKVYAWTHPDILDRAAFIADLEGKSTHRIIFWLWCCGFDVPDDALRAAWHDMIARALRAWSKQDISVTPTEVNAGYFEALADVFHRFAIYAVKASRAGKATPQLDMYPIAQAGLMLLFTSEISADLANDIEYINLLFNSYAPKSELDSGSNLDILNKRATSKIRKIANLFEVKDAVQNSKKGNFEQTRFVWETLCRFVLIFLPEVNQDIGFTYGRRIRAVFGPALLSCILTSIQTKGGNNLIELFHSISPALHQLERAKIKRRWTTPEEFNAFIESNKPTLDPQIPELWRNFISKI